MAELRKFLERVSKVVEDEFNDEGNLEPTYFVITPKGGVLVPMPNVSDRDFAMFLIRKVMKDIEARTYVFYDEAWTLTASSKEELPKGIANHPNRIEIVFLAAEDYESGMIMAQRAIIRVEGQPARLGPLEIQDMKNEHLEGRMVGLLPPRGRVN